MKNYKDDLTKITEHQYDLKTADMKVPARFFMSEDLLPPDETFAQAASVASNENLFRHTVAMPDVCSKPGRKNASGTTIVSDTHLLPQVNDSDPNCGMRLVKTSLTDQDTTPEDLDLLFQQLVSAVPTKAYVGTKVPFQTVVDICAKGTQSLIDYLGVETKNEIANSQSKGNFFGAPVDDRTIFDAIPKLYLHVAKYRLGLIGAAGNHFLDLMKVTDIVEPDIAQKFGLTKGQYLFMIHTGSGILGQYAMYTYTAKKREHLSQALMVALGANFTFDSKKEDVYKQMQKKIHRHMHGDESLLTYAANEPEGELYMNARAAASNFGTANRATITHNVSETIKNVLNRDPELDLLYDLPHISINREQHFDTDVWVHRNNTSRAYGPARMKDHPLFKETGEPVFIPSSMSTDAYVCVGTDANEESFFSAPHGTGKTKTVTDNFVPKDRAELMQKMEKKGVRLYNAQSGKTIQQDSSQYKNINAVMDGVGENGIARVVAKMSPVSVIMY